jgi:hypothetical protein
VRTVLPTPIGSGEVSSLLSTPIPARRESY